MYVSADTVSHRSIEHVTKKLIQNVVNDINGQPDLLIVTFTASYRQKKLYEEALKTIKEESHVKKIIGGTFPAVVTSNALPTIKGGSMLAIKSRELDVTSCFYHPNVRMNQKKAAKKIERAYKSTKEKSKMAIVLSAGTTFPEDAMQSMKILDTLFARKFPGLFNVVGTVIEKIQAKAGYGSTVYISRLLKHLYKNVKNLIGGATLDLDIKPNYQFIEDKVLSNGLVGTIISSDKIKFAQHWTFDQSEKNVSFDITQTLNSGYIQTIDNKLAGEEFLSKINISRELYNEAFSRYWYASLLYATAIVTNENEYPFVSVSHPSLKGLVTSLPIYLLPKKELKARLFTQSGLGVVTSAKRCAEACKQQLNKVLFGIFVNCANRLLISGDKIYEENKAIKEELGDIPFISLYSGGEFSIINGLPIMSSISIHGMVAGN